MATQVTLHMYSGVPNPTWELTDTESAKLKELYGTEKAESRVRIPVSLLGLGYRGFEVQSSLDIGLPNRLMAFDGILDTDDVFQKSFIDANSRIEQFILETAGSALTKDELEEAQAAIAKNLQGGSANTNNLIIPLAEPPYNPGRWNDPSVRPHNNCYNYANDKITNTFAQPGRCSTGSSFAIGCASTGQGARSDGLSVLASPHSTPAEGHYAALVIWPGRDYHWYRRDNNGMWSHKPGQTAARNTDNSGRTISDPSTCDRGPYTDFCGYYHSIPRLTCVR